MIEILQSPAEALSSQKFPPENEVVRLARPAAAGLPGYYGLPLVKPPRWKWEIALYFFFEGISAGAFVLAGTAHLFGGGRHRRLVRNGRRVALLALLPCPPLLIADLGRPERFHHMLRIVKPTSPMNTGAWALTGFGMFAALLAGRERLPFLRFIPERAAEALGIPFALTMLAYPGVLLSATSNPVWAHTPFLGALFGCSSISAAAATLALLAPSRSLERLETTAAVCETAALAGYLATARRAAQPLTSGSQAGQFWLGAVGCGLLLPAVLGRKRGILRSLASIAGALMLKWAVTHAGHSSAMDAEASRYLNRPSEAQPGWMPGTS